MSSESPCLPRKTVPFVLGIVLALAGTAPAQILTVGQVTAKPVMRSNFGLAEDPKPKDEKPLPKYTVGECIAIAQERQPKLKALRASVAASQAGQRGLDGARWLVHLTPDYKSRVQQSSLGVCAASAELEQATHDVTQAVVWTYYSVVYAQQQVIVASDAVEFVDFYRKQVETIVNSKEGGNREINQLTLNRLIASLAEGERLLIKARAGYDKAQAGLREAMGVDHEYYFLPADEALPDFGKFEIVKETVIAHAQTRRGEVILAGLASEVTRLEAYIQWSLRLRYRTTTFANGADIHSRSLPPGSKDGEYRPDAVGPEMPPTMFGDRNSRTQKAWAYVDRSKAVLEKTRNLVTLEAEVAFIDWRQAGEAMIRAKRQADAGSANLKSLKEVAGDKVSTTATLQQLLEAQRDSSQGMAAFNEAIYLRIVALANIERITAGGIKINYPGR